MPLHNILFACSSKHPAGPARKLVTQDRSQAGLTNQGYASFTKHSGPGARPVTPEACLRHDAGALRRSQKRCRWGWRAA